MFLKRTEHKNSKTKFLSVFMKTPNLYLSSLLFYSKLNFYDDIEVWKLIDIWARNEKCIVYKLKKGDDIFICQKTFVSTVWYSL